MSNVAAHLQIELTEYDDRIRMFVPHYETMLDLVARGLNLVDTASPRIVDLGTGTGALAARALAERPDARIIGIDSDAGMLAAARQRLAADAGARFMEGNFLQTVLPPCHAIIACIALHHIRDAEAKPGFYRTCASALHRGGLLINGDCMPAVDPLLAAEQHEAWLSHLQQSYSRTEAEGHLAAWANEDTYFPLDRELEWLRAAQLAPEVIWRADGFAVVAARKC